VTDKTPDETLAAHGMLYGASIGFHEEFPFLEEGKVVNGQHWRRGPGPWRPVPDPREKFLKEQP